MGLIVSHSDLLGANVVKKIKEHDQKTDSSGTTSYVYDSENRLVQINAQPVTGNPQLVTYKYDPFGRRIEKNVNGTITRYVYDREDILFELDGNNNIITEYLHGPGIDEPIAMIRNNQTYYYHADGLGSIIAITDSAGRVVQRYEYDSFGNITYQQDATFKQPYTYTGREYDEKTGLYYYRARYYDAKIGRFLQKDPIGFNGGINFYTYVGNNPIKFIDPFGLSSLTFSGDGSLYIYDDNGFLLGSCQAGNNVTRGSRGPWPSGTNNFSHYNPRPESGLTGPYGSYGIFVFDVPGRSGMGVHSGRSGPDSPTEGCIRTTDPCMEYLNQLHQRDPIKRITVQ